MSHGFFNKYPVDVLRIPFPICWNTLWRTGILCLAFATSKCKFTGYTVTLYPIKFRLCLRGIWSDVMRVCASEKYATKKICTGTNDKLLDYPVTLYSIFLEILCHILSFRIASKWQPELRWKSAQKLKGKKSGLIAGAPKKIHRQKQNISEKNIKK